MRWCWDAPNCPLLVRTDDCHLPVLDSTRLLSGAALLKALGREGESNGARRKKVETWSMARAGHFFLSAKYNDLIDQ